MASHRSRMDSNFITIIYVFASYFDYSFVGLISGEIVFNKLPTVFYVNIYY